VADHPSTETDALVGEIFVSCNVEVRVADSFDTARKLLQEVPVAMVLAHNRILNHEGGVELLTWVRNNYTSIHRVLISEQVSAELMEAAINEAAINYFVPMPLKRGTLPAVVDAMLYA